MAQAVLVRVQFRAPRLRKVKNRSLIIFRFFKGPDGEIGRHVRFRGVCRKVCWFESSSGHFIKTKVKTPKSGKEFGVPK